MKLVTLVTAVVLVAFAGTARAFSPIWNVDGWNAARLASAGITVVAWHHDSEAESPADRWVRVTFDAAAVPADRSVVMTAWFRAADGTTLAASRVDRAAAAVDGKLTLTIRIPPMPADTSYVEIHVWSKTGNGGSAAVGYRLSLRRISELAGN